MRNDNHFLDINLLGKEYRVACPPEEQSALQAAVAYVDGKMHDIAEKTKNNISERIAVMAALNIAHEYLSLQGSAAQAIEKSGDLALENKASVLDEAGRRISVMEAQLDALLMSQNKLL